MQKKMLKIFTVAMALGVSSTALAFTRPVTIADQGSSRRQGGAKRRPVGLYPACQP